MNFKQLIAYRLLGKKDESKNESDMASDKIEVYSASASIVYRSASVAKYRSFWLLSKAEFIYTESSYRAASIIVSLTLKVHLCLKYLILSTYTSAIYATICVLPDS